MANSTLHLVVVKGPKPGETLARNAGSLIRVGRVARGNTFPIKDSGISQKHLTIEFVSAISKWTVMDLDTSNGTFVNDIKIPSLTPFPLSNGDTIKIGESTSISVKIDGDGEADGPLRRGSRRGLRSRAGSLDSVAEDKGGIESNGEVAVEELKNVGRGRRRKGDSSRVTKKDETLDAAVEDNIEAKPRRAGLRSRATSARISKEEGPSESNNVEADSVLKKNEPLDSVAEDSIEAPKKKRARPKKAPAQTRASSAKVLQADELCRCNSPAEEVSEIGRLNVESNAAEKNKNVVSGRAEKGEMVEEEVGEIGGLNVESNAAEKNNDLVSGRTEKGETVEEEVSEIGRLNVEINAAEKHKDVGSGRKRKAEMVEEETVVDFEKMTLGGWLDSMEKHLPHAINEVAEQMIADLREKARLFDEYVMNATNDG